MSTKRSSPHREDRNSGTLLEDHCDLDLARLACQGEKAAWDALYLRHWNFLWHFARERLKLPQELHGSKQQELSGHAITAEQFVNEIYVLMWQRKRFCSYEGRAQFRQWYAAVAANIFSDLCRQERKALPSGKRIPFEEEDDE
jgi:DNA-directed RNA polymerase specialized sigma24 family protein